MSYINSQSVDWYWFTSTGIWALCYGVRGILWHQFYDRDNDIQAGIKTFAVSVAPNNFKKKEVIILSIELIAIAVMLFNIHQLLPFLALFVYILVALSRSYKLKYTAVIIIAPEQRPYHIIMADFYQVYFPLSLLCVAALSNPYILIVLLIHLILFPMKTIASLKDLRQLISFK